MKKLFTLILSLLLTGVYTTASAQQNIFVWKNGGNLSVVSAASIDSVSFSVGSWLFNITTSTPVSVTTSSFEAVASVSLNEGVKSLSVSPEVGVCYSDENEQPICNDYCKKLGNSMTDYTISINDVDPGTTFYYRTYVKFLDEVYYDSNVLSVTTLGTKPVENNLYVTINNHKFVDLGLPSGLLWAECNVGASSAYVDGEYYSWGEIETKSDYSSSNYKWGRDYNNENYTKYNLSDYKKTLDASDDVATVKWGKGCRMPSQLEFRELYNKCVWAWNSNYNGTSGYLVIGPNGSSIFLPASGLRGNRGYEGDLYVHGSCGYYWSATLSGSSAYNLYFSSDWVNPSDTYGRSPGFAVRPVAEK